MARTRMLIVMMALSAIACSKEPSRWEAAEQKADKAAEQGSEPKEKEKGGTFNAYFPKAGPNGATRIFTAEKPGYAEAKLEDKAGDELALLAISEAAPDAITKFEGASDEVGGFPLVTVGKNQSSVLVNKRFQVKVSSKTLGADERKTLLQTFDLKGLGAR